MEIRPFRGYRYNLDVVGDLGKVAVPPYDVIDAEGAAQLQASHPNNMAHITKATPNTAPGPEGDHVYAHAGKLWREWVESGAVTKDEADAYYVYAQRFVLPDGREMQRLGLIGALQLAQFGEGVGAHEQTLAGPRADRLNLTRGTRVQIGQIFLLYRDETRTVDVELAAAAQGTALGEFTDDEGVHHALYAITDKAAQERIAGVFADKTLFIADGHHRYETSLNFMAEHPELADAKFRMVTVVNTENEGLVVLPTHRLVRNVADFDLATLYEKMGPRFNIVDGPADPKELLAEVARAGANRTIVFGVYAKGEGRLITLKDPNEPITALAALQNRGGEPASETFRKLDVTVLHKLLLEAYLGIDDEALTKEANVDYIKDIGDAVERAAARVDAGEAQALFLMNATRTYEVAECAELGERMPQKSTFFHPKVFSGLVMRAIEA
jgi:uncharacterized protein (DUF1015 family)